MGWQSFVAAGLAGVAWSATAFAAYGVGTEFRVNTYTAGDQAYPAVCADRQGRTVVVWESTGQDGSGNAVRAQRYDGAGAPLGSELEVNGFTTGNQQLPSVTCDRSGGFVVVWESRDQDGDDYGVVGRKFDGAGAPSGGEFAVNTATTERQNAAATCNDADGNFVVVWQSYDQDGDGYGIFGQRFDAAGARRGTEFQVNSFTDYSQERPAVACSADGGFVVVWQGGAQDGDGYGIFGQRLDSDGAKAGSEFRINTYTTGTQQLPVVASADGGSFVVVWESYDDQDGDGYGIFGQRFSSTGEPSGSEFRVNANTAYSQQKPAISAGAAGDFIVAWSSPDDDGYGVFARTFDATGTPAGTAEFRVNSYTLGDQGAVSTEGHVLSVASAPGGFLIAWQSLGVTVPDQDGSGTGVYAQRYESGSACLGDCDGNGMVQINELVTGVGIALGSISLQQCPAFDRNANPGVDISELVTAVNAALNGCP